MWGVCFREIIAYFALDLTMAKSALAAWSLLYNIYNNMSAPYKASDRLCQIISDDHHLLQMMSRFGIALGVGEKTVAQVCEEHKVDTATFLAVANYMKQGPAAAIVDIEKVSVEALTAYLAQAHRYFLQFQLPAIRRKLLEAIDCSEQNEVAYLILKFYDDYMAEVRRHMQFENKRVFTYVKQLLSGRKPADFCITQFADSHKDIDHKLQELKNIIIKYYAAPADGQLLHNVLFDIFVCEGDLRTHCALENDLFVPAVKLLEEQLKDVTDSGDADDTLRSGATTGAEALSEREVEVLRHVVRGMTNKETAAKLFISLNTVLTHRKNISRKLNIHSVAGLTIYAIAQGIVHLDEVKMH